MELYDHLQVAKAYRDLGWAVQEQIEDLLDDPSVADLNPNAVELIERNFLHALQSCDTEAAEDLAAAIKEWKEQ